MPHADEPSKPRRRRGKSHAATPVSSSVVAPSAPLTLAEAIGHERVQLMQIQAMLKCLYEVLLYADDDDSVMHADVASVSARLLQDSVVRLELLVARATELAEQVDALSQEAAAIPPRHHEVKDRPAAYLC